MAKKLRNRPDQVVEARPIAIPITRLQYIIAIACIALTAIAVFYLPLKFPPEANTLSVAIDFGFNNRVAMLGLLVCILLAAWCAQRYYRNHIQRQDHVFNLFETNPSEHISYLHLLIVAVIGTLLVFDVYRLFQPNYGDSLFFRIRVDRLLDGKTPYLDFEYCYGPLFLYVAAYAYRLTGVYFPLLFGIIYAVFTLAAFWMLYYVINRLAVAKKQKTFIFYLISLAYSQFILAMTFHALLLRYVTPIFSLLVFHQIISAENPSENAPLRIVKAWGALLGLIVLNLALSPEMGIALALAALTYLTFTGWAQDRRLLLIPIAIALTFVVAGLALPKNFYWTLKSFATGGANWPIIPAFSVLFYIYSSLFIGAVVGGWYWLNRRNHLLPAMIALGVVLIPPALGRCDPSHLLQNGLAVYILSFGFFARSSVRAFRGYAAGFILVFVILLGFTTYFFTTAYFKSDHFDFKSDQHRVTPETRQELFAFLDIYTAPYTKIVTPIAMGPYTVYDYLYTRKKMVPEYFLGFENVMTEEQVRRKLAEFDKKDHKILLVPLDVLISQPSTDGEVKAIPKLFMFPFNWHRKVDTGLVKKPVYEYIHRHYRLVEDFDGRGPGVLMKRIDPEIDPKHKAAH